MKSEHAKILFYLIRGGGMALIHIFPIFLITYTLFNLGTLENLIIYFVYALFYNDLFPLVISYGEAFFIPLLFYIILGLFIWALVIWPVARKYFPPLYFVMNGVQIREGRVWWRSPNKITHFLKKLADIGGVEYKEERIWLYRSGKFLNPLKPIASMNKLYIPDDSLKKIEVAPQKILFYDLFVLNYKDGYILLNEKFKSERIDIEKLNRIIKEDSDRISKTVGDYALINPELRVKNVSSALFWVPPANLEVREHIRVGSESVGFETLEKLIEKYDQAKERALKDGTISSEEISNMLLPLFNQLLIYVNSMKAKFENDLLPDPPKLKNNLITLEEMESYINEIRTAIGAYNNPEVFR